MENRPKMGYKYEGCYSSPMFFALANGRCLPSGCSSFTQASPQRSSRDSSFDQCLIRLGEGPLCLGEPEASSFLPSLASLRWRDRRSCLFTLANHFTSAKQCFGAGSTFLPSSLVALLSIPTKHKQMGD